MEISTISQPPVRSVAPGTEAAIRALGGFNVPAHDYASLVRDGSGNLTSVVYKTNGSSGTTVATLTFGRDGSNRITSITKS